MRAATPNHRPSGYPPSPRTLTRRTANPRPAFGAFHRALGVSPISTALMASLLPALVTACSLSETVSPVPVGTTTTTTEPTATTTSTIPDGSPPKRTVSLRSPLPGPANNLLLDGDFELSTSYGTGQYGWRMFNSTGTGEIAMTVETGGLCRTGLTCVKVHKSQILLGRGTAAAAGKGHFLDLWAKMPEGVGCGKIDVIAVECDTFAILKNAVNDKDPVDGWCHHHATFEPATSSVCLYIQTSLAVDQEALLDSGVLGPDDGTITLSAAKPDPPDADTLARMSALRDYVSRTTPLGTSAGTAPSPRY